uniref:Uncharacterized protein n=1 Tax=Spermophilus dauricus TaxID=99837 RepID=A0A8C9NZU4_SPEDA
MTYFLPRVTFLVDGRFITFLLDTGAAFSVLREYWGPTTPSKTPIVGVGGKQIFPRKPPPLSCYMQGSLLSFTHSFLVMSHCPTPLLGRDILSLLKVTIHISPHISPTSHFLMMFLGADTPPSHTLPQLSKPVNPEVWDTTTPSMAKCSPIHIVLRDPSRYISQPQYPLTTTALLGLEPIIQDLLRKGYLRPTHSPFNTPILAVKKPNGSYRLVQDLRLVNSSVVPIHPLVPNPYTLFFQIPATTTHFLVLDLKDAFFSIPLSSESQDIFAFTWTDPHTHHSRQLTWTVLPQGFRDSPHLFGQVLAQDLTSFHPTCPDSTLLQYVDDLLLCSPSWEHSQSHTAQLLNFLADKGYRVSPHKAQVSQSSVTYLGIVSWGLSRIMTSAGHGGTCL